MTTASSNLDHHLDHRLDHQYYPVVIIGGSQAGLSLSHCLRQQHIDHLIIEKNRIGHAWRNERRDTF